jgi:hypothetical protein
MSLAHPGSIFLPIKKQPHAKYFWCLMMVLLHPWIMLAPFPAACGIRNAG